MRTWPRRLLLWGLGGLTGGLGLAFLVVAVSYLAAETPEPVARTVADDPSLPSLEVDGIRLHLQTFGDRADPVVVVIHGGPGDDHLMLLPLAALADEYFVVLYDQRGSGLSERVPDELLTYEGMLGELGLVVDHFSPDAPVRLVGHSWGAMLASGYLGQHPGRVLQAVLAEPGFLTPEAGAAFLEATGGMPSLSLELVSALWWTGMESLHLDGPDGDARADYVMLRLATTDVEDNPMSGYFCGGKPEPGSLEHFRFGTRANMVVRSGSVAEDGSLIAPFAHGVDAFPRKVLFMVGECNSSIGEDHQRRYHVPLFSQAELVVVEGAGHLMYGEEPERSLEIVRTYFSESP